MKYTPTQIFHFHYFSLNDLDKQLEEYLDFDNEFFVEYGANDGADQSNILFFERFRSWKGELIEPFQRDHMELIRNQSSTIFFKNATSVGRKFVSHLGLYHVCAITKPATWSKN